MKRIFIILTGIFISLSGIAQDVNYIEYFIDTDPGFGQATPIENFTPGQDINTLLNITQELSPGFHNIGIRSKDAYSWSQTNFASVLILEDTTYNPILKIEYFWLSDPGFSDPQCSDTILAESHVNLNDGKVAVQVPYELAVGNNSLFVRVQDDNGAWSHTQLVGDIYVCSSSFLVNVVDSSWCSYNSPSGNVYTESGVYREYISTPLECDSSFLIDLTIKQIDTAVYLIEETLTANDTTADSYQWIDCDNGNTPVPGETNYMFTPTESGNYAAIITHDNCSDTSGCYQVTIGGIADQRNNVIQVFPNPNSGTFTLETEVPDYTRLEIRNSLGEIIYARKLSGERKIDIALDESSGVYFLHLIGSKSARIQKFIIK